MKTKNVFELTADTVTMSIYDLTGFNKGDDTSTAPLLAQKVFDVSAIPDLLEDGENCAKSIKAYGLSRIMQDRSSDYTDGKLAESCGTPKEAADARLEAYTATYDLLCEGLYKAKREGKGKTVAVDTFFAQALCDLLKEQGKDMDINTATVYLQQRSNEERKALRKRLQPLIEEARKEARKAADELDLDSLLG